MTDRRTVLRALLRQDLPSFTAKCFATLEPGRAFRDNWHIHHIGWQLKRVADGEVRRLAITIPPRHLKSICVTVAYTAWAMGHDPGLKVLAVSYSDELAHLHATAFRTVVESPWYRDLFPKFEVARARKSEVATTAHGFRYAASVGGSILGRGADLIVVDDPIKAQAALSAAERRRVKEFWDNTLYTRLNDKGRGAIVIVMQRLHDDDLVGHVTRKEAWEVARIPAIETEDREYRVGPGEGDVHLRRAGDVIDPGRENATVLEQVRRTLGSMGFAAQYQQDPVPPDGNAVRREWLRFYDAEPADGFDLVVASWDTASTLGEASDWSVGTVWGLKGADVYLLDVVRGAVRGTRAAPTHRSHDAPPRGGGDADREDRHRTGDTPGDAVAQPGATDPLAASLRQGGAAVGAGTEVRGWASAATPRGAMAGHVHVGAAGFSERGARRPGRQYLPGAELAVTQDCPRRAAGPAGPHAAARSGLEAAGRAAVGAHERGLHAPRPAPRCSARAGMGGDLPLAPGAPQ